MFCKIPATIVIKIAMEASHSPETLSENGRVIFNKLVRDKFNNVPDGAVKWVEAETRKAGSLEYEVRLLDKFAEEAEEIAAAKTPKERKEEFADFLELIYAAADYYGFSIKHIMAISAQSGKTKIDQDNPMGSVKILMDAVRSSKNKKDLRLKLAGLYGFFDSAVEFYGMSIHQIEKIRETKLITAGGFSQHTVLESARMAGK